MCVLSVSVFFFFFNDTATTEIYTLSLHDALPIWWPCSPRLPCPPSGPTGAGRPRSVEHTSELQSRLHLVCRLLLEKTKKDDSWTRATDPPSYSLAHSYALTRT